MRNLFNFFRRKEEPEERNGYMAESEHPLDREIDALYGMLADILGSDKFSYAESAAVSDDSDVQFAEFTV